MPMGQGRRSYVEVEGLGSEYYLNFQETGHSSNQSNASRGECEVD